MEFLVDYPLIALTLAALVYGLFWIRKRRKNDNAQTSHAQDEVDSKVKSFFNAVSKRYFGLSYQAWIGLSLIVAIVWYAISATKSGERSYEELYVALIIAVVGAVLVFRDWLKPRRLSRVWRVLSISGVALVCSVVMLLVLGAARMEWGSCVSGDCESGYGTFNYFSGDIYEGEFRNGQRTLGTFRQINGKTYVGEWRDGIPDGQGTTTFSNGDVYVGEHLGFSPWGTGTKTYADGRVESGQWKFGRLVEPE